MNKYLLLRNNKQSGPFTVPEIIAMGIKPYDLVWLEGKSAAWRYPSEIEELKAYAPAVEEQPFDRFYKKPQPEKEIIAPSNTAATDKKQLGSGVVTDNSTENHERFLPKIPVKAEELSPAKKVYVNFPASPPAQKIPAFSENLKQVPQVIESKTPAHIPERESFSEKNSVVDGNEHGFSSNQPTGQHNKSFAPNNGQALIPSGQNRRMLQVAIAACVLLGFLSGILLFNFYRQRDALQELNSKVQQIEEVKLQQRAMNAALIQKEEAPVTPVPDTNRQTDAVIEEETKPTPPPARQPNKQVKKPENTLIQESEPSVVFTEGRPVERRSDSKTGGQEISDESKENLFKLVEVTPNDYKIGLLGGISNLKFEITNKSQVELHRVAVEVKYLGPEKKVVKKHTVYFENVSPGGQSTISVPKSNRGVTIEYTITDIKS